MDRRRRGRDLFASGSGDNVIDNATAVDRQTRGAICFVACTCRLHTFLLTSCYAASCLSRTCSFHFQGNVVSRQMQTEPWTESVEQVRTRSGGASGAGGNQQRKQEGRGVDLAKTGAAGELRGIAGNARGAGKARGDSRGGGNSRRWGQHSPSCPGFPVDGAHPHMHV